MKAFFSRVESNVQGAHNIIIVNKTSVHFSQKAKKIQKPIDKSKRKW